MTQTLYTIGVLARELGIPARQLQYWASEERSEWGYVEPYAVATRTGSKDTFMKLWHPDQVEAVNKGYIAYKQYFAEQRIATQRRRKAYLEAYNAEYYRKKLAKEGKEVKPRVGRKPGPKPKPDDDRAFVEKFDKEREEKALQFLLRLEA
jgi:hypothetical protein